MQALCRHSFPQETLTLILRFCAPMAQLLEFSITVVVVVINGLLAILHLSIYIHVCAVHLKSLLQAKMLKIS